MIGTFTSPTTTSQGNVAMLLILTQMLVGGPLDISWFISAFRKNVPEELRNPGAIDFIRRCKTNEEAMEILDYLLKREELTPERYKELSNQISQEGGLKKLIDEAYQARALCDSIQRRSIRVLGYADNLLCRLV